MLKSKFAFLVLSLLCLSLVLAENNIQYYSSRFLSTESDNSTVTIVGVKCFWLEPTHLIYNFTSGSDLILFNFCDDVLPKCHDSLSQVSLFDQQDSSNCVRLSDRQKSTNNWTLLNSSDPNEGFEIILNTGEQCKAKPEQNYTTSYVMKCNEFMKTGDYNLTSAGEFNKNNCHNELNFESFEACPKANFYAIWDFLQTYRIFFGIILILIGLFEILLGAKLMIVTIFLTSCLLTVTVVFIFLFQFIIPNGANPAILWVVLGISSTCGIFLGYLISKYNRLIIGLILGGYMGYFLGILLYNVALNHIQANPAVIFWVTILTSILVCCVIAYFLVTHIIITATSFCGAYAFIRGVSLYTEGFPNESYVIDLIKNDELDTLKSVLTPVVYAYLAGWIILFILGVIFQYKTQTAEEKKPEEDENSKYFLFNNKKK